MPAGRSHARSRDGAKPSSRPLPHLPLDRFPEVYDAAFSWDRTREADTYLRIGTTHLGRPPDSVAELACGTGTLARIWAGRGLRVVGLDRNSAALHRARLLSQQQTPAPEWVRGDLRRFTIGSPVDLAVLPLDGLTYLVGRTGLLGFFRSASRSLRPGGVLLFDTSIYPVGRAPRPMRHRWTVRLRPSGTMLVTWESRGRPSGTPRRRTEVATFRVNAPSGAVQLFRESALHSVLSGGAIRELALRKGAFRGMVVYDRPAHRERSPLPRPLRADPRREGAHLVALWK